MRSEIGNAIDFSLERVRKNIPLFSSCFPSSQSKDYVYQGVSTCIDWVEGFWTGLLWLCYDLSGDEEYRKCAEGLMPFFQERVEKKTAVETHDLGFLYSLSAVACYKRTGNEEARRIALLAADFLLARYHEKGGFIQAWGSYGAPENYRLIIDCMLNVPLLFWASETTGDEKYRNAALRHVRTTAKVIVRADGSTYHTFFFNPEDGNPDHGETHQGFSDDSCWARGQSWGVYGFALCYSYTRDEEDFRQWKRVTDYFLSHLPVDLVPYWDLCFTDGSGEPRDTSSAAIAISGIYEMARVKDIPEYVEMADRMLSSLIEKYLGSRIDGSNGLLTDAMYGRPRGDKDEHNIWGDYFFLEALVKRSFPDWQRYW